MGAHRGHARGAAPLPVESSSSAWMPEASRGAVSGVQPHTGPCMLSWLHQGQKPPRLPRCEASRWALPLQARGGCGGGVGWGPLPGPGQLPGTGAGWAPQVPPASSPFCLESTDSSYCWAEPRQIGVGPPECFQGEDPHLCFVAAPPKPVRKWTLTAARTPSGQRSARPLWGFLGRAGGPEGAGVLQRLQWLAGSGCKGPRAERNCLGVAGTGRQLVHSWGVRASGSLPVQGTEHRVSSRCAQMQGKGAGAGVGHDSGQQPNSKPGVESLLRLAWPLTQQVVGVVLASPQWKMGFEGPCLQHSSQNPQHLCSSPPGTRQAHSMPWAQSPHWHWTDLWGSVMQDGHPRRMESCFFVT